MARILIVDCDEESSHAMRDRLVEAGHAVRQCTNGLKAVDLVRANPPDALILELALPAFDGLDLIGAIRHEVADPAVRRLPIIVVSSRASEIDRVVGLEVGADDYLAKPVSMPELLARLLALLRRSEGYARLAWQPPQIHSGDLVVDLDAHRVTRNGNQLHLKPREFDLLVYLLRQAGQALTRERLLQGVWGIDEATETRTVDVHVRWLRSKIEPDPARPRRLQTVRGVGYALVS